MKPLPVLAGLVLAVALAIACSPSRSTPADQMDSLAEGLTPSVQAVVPERRTLIREIRLPASVEAFEQTMLYAKVSGYLKTIHVDKGDRVRKGQVLAVLDVPEMAAEAEEVKARLAEAVAEAELRRITFERLSKIQVKEPEVISQQEVDLARAEMERARAAVNVARASQSKLEALMHYSSLYAPFSGVVTERFVDLGALIQSAAATRQATPVVTVMNMSKVRVYVHVPESDVRYVKEGKPALLEVDALAGRRFDATVTRFTSALDLETRTMKVEIDFLNADGALLHGMYGNVTLTFEERADALCLPPEVLFVEEGQSFVFCVRDGAIEKRAVTTGMEAQGVVEILKGLSGSERVVTGDRSGLQEGMKVQLVESASHGEE